ncbi:hypothetical protein KP509_03G065300 [Ceratopteris richardii]|uniref:Uncharacterized protein n=1 Tax=Ceratopteris richardii TaxID=49495 RepID=A0A8T2V7M0_CERRI|nr:hypothetical protein KP509_03G065300 [Ceratopteris richardii]
MKFSGFSIVALLLLCIALCCTFRINFIAKAQDIDLHSGTLSESYLTSMQWGKVDSRTDTLILNASTNQLAMAFYKSAMHFYDTVTQSVRSFSTVFTFTSGSTYANGTIAFVAVRDPMTTRSIDDARKTFTVEFKASCSRDIHGGHKNLTVHDGRGLRGRLKRRLCGFDTVQYTNGASIDSNVPSGYGAGWETPPEGSYFCSQQLSVDASTPMIIKYVVPMEYSAKSKTVFVGGPSCGSGFVRTLQFDPQDLSTVIESPVYVGFIVSGNATFNLTQWNFTSNAKNSTVFNLALPSSIASTTRGGSTNADGAKWTGSHYSTGSGHTQV